MTKAEIHRRLIDQLSREVDELTAAAKNSISMATNEAHRAESKYDTFSLESSYLARGQAARLEELSHALKRLQALQLKAFTAATPIQLSALVRLESGEGQRRTLFFGPAAGGEQVQAEGEEPVTVITALSPLGKAVLGKTVGTTFEFKAGRATYTYTVVSVE
jgi:transcription elongation GreA/GreB family factor